MPVPTGEGATHTLLEFGAMRMDRGKAFLLPGTVGQEIPVRQTWEIRDGRRFLVERTDWTLLEPLLREIPGASMPARALRRTERTARLELPARRGPVSTSAGNAFNAECTCASSSRWMYRTVENSKIQSLETQCGMNANRRALSTETGRFLALDPVRQGLPMRGPSQGSLSEAR